MNTTLNPPYGGTLVQQIETRGAEALAGAPILTVSEVAALDIMNLATGMFSPLTGFMTAEDFQLVCTQNRLRSGLSWTLPIVLDVDADDVRTMGRAERVLLRAAVTGKMLGYLEPTAVYPHDQRLHMQAAYGTTDTRHPGVALVAQMKPQLVAGRVVAFQSALDPDPLAYPAGVRARLGALGLRTVAGFQTRNIVHRAHEYLQRIALELCDGLLIHPLVGWKKLGDFRPEIVRAVYQEFVNDFFPAQRVLLAFLQTAMRYAGPKEAVFHAIIRKNYGCSHFIVGRDHAGVGSYYDKYEAHRLFETLPPLGIEILRLHGPYFCRACNLIVTEKTCGHDARHHEEISGTAVRSLLTSGEDPEGHFLRPEVLACLRRLQQQGTLFHD